MLPDRLSSLVLASYWKNQQSGVSARLEVNLQSQSAVSHLGAALPAEEHV